MGAGLKPVRQLYASAIAASDSLDRLLKGEGCDVAVDGSLRDAKRPGKACHGDTAFPAQDVHDGIAALKQVYSSSPPAIRSMFGSITVKPEAALRIKKSFSPGSINSAFCNKIPMQIERFAQIWLM